MEDAVRAGVVAEDALVVLRVFAHHAPRLRSNNARVQQPSEWRSIRLRLLIRTYAPWRCTARV